MAARQGLLKCYKGTAPDMISVDMGEPRLIWNQVNPLFFFPCLSVRAMPLPVLSLVCLAAIIPLRSFPEVLVFWSGQLYPRPGTDC